MGPQVRGRACLPLTLHLWSPKVPRWNHSDGVPLAKSANATWRGTLAGTTSRSHKHVEFKVNSPLTILPKIQYA